MEALAFPPTRLSVAQVHRWAIALHRAASLFQAKRFAELYFGPDAQLEGDGFPGFRPAVLYWVATAERERLTHALLLSAAGLMLEDLPAVASAVSRYQTDFLEDCRQLWAYLQPILPFKPALDVAALGEVLHLPPTWLVQFNAATELARRQPSAEETWVAWCELALVARTAQSAETIRSALVLGELDARLDLPALVARAAPTFGQQLTEFFFTQVLGGVADAPRATGERLGRNGVFAEHDLSKTHLQPWQGLLGLVGAWLGGPPLRVETHIRTCSFQTQTQVVLAAEGRNPRLGRHLCTLCAAFDQATLEAMLPRWLMPRSQLHASLGQGAEACRFTAEFGLR
ncbi:MAG: hypothetical protein ACUVR8_10070 [Acidobacteriota bacterium]